jgi:hypothetical protein
MDGLRDIHAVLRAFDDGALSAAQLVQRYMALWRELVDEQDAAIAAHPEIGDALNDLRQRLSDGDISAAQYTELVRQQYALLDGVRLRPGSPQAQALDQVYVEADAYRDESGTQSEPSISADELHVSVRRTLEVLETA